MRLSTGTRLSVDAVLFDMDGTLVDSTGVVERVWRRWSARHGVDPDALLAVSHGRRSEDTMQRFAPAGTDLAAEVAWLTAIEIASCDGLAEVRGAGALLAALPPERVAVVTSAPRALAAMRLQCVGLPVPSVLIGAEDVAHGKPHPQGYQEAARRLGVRSDRCLVFEDAPAGLEAGRAAGAQVLAVATMLAGAEREAWDWVPDLGALRVVPPAADPSPHAGAITLVAT